MLDTNSCIFIIREKPMEVLRQFDKYRPGDTLVSSIVLAELNFEVEKSKHIDKKIDKL